MGKIKGKFIENSTITEQQLSSSVNLSLDKADNSVQKTGNETIGGIKTFSSFPLTPNSTPTTDYQVVNKKYVDDNSGGGISNVFEDTTPDLGGNLNLNNFGLKIQGQTVAGSNGNIVYLSGSNSWSVADATTEKTYNKLLGIRLSSTEVLLDGIYTTTGLTAGSTYYISETSGLISTSEPTSTGTLSIIIGYAITSTKLLLKINNTNMSILG